MKTVIVKIYLCLAIFTSFLYSFEYVKQEFLTDCAMRQGSHNQQICKLFSQFDYLYSSKASCIDYINIPEVKTMFQEPVCCSNAERARLLVIVQIYQVFFKDVAKQITIHLQKIITAKQYWIGIAKQESLPLCFKRSNFLKSRKISKGLIDRRIKLLHVLEMKQFERLGICLFCKNKLEQIDSLDQVEDRLNLILEPLQIFCPKETFKVIIDLYHNMSSLLVQVQEMQADVYNLVKSYGIPQHVDRYWPVYLAITTASIAGFYVWYQYKDCGIKYQEKAQRALQGFWSDFVLAPLHGLKRALWDRPDFGLKKFDLDAIPHTVWSCYTPERLIKYPLQTILYDINKGIDVAEEIIKGQQINYYLSAIVPLLAGLYAIYREGRYYYNHESYFKPMRTILRKIDIYCTQLLSKKMENMSFGEQGQLYFFVNELQRYLICLNNQEREMMEYDLQELLSFDTSIEQKVKIVERIYRTYAFLK